MKSFDLNALGVQEMNVIEEKTVNGGMTIEELIQICWDATPDGMNGTFTPWESGWNYGFDAYYWNF